MRFLHPDGSTLCTNKAREVAIKRHEGIDQMIAGLDFIQMGLQHFPARNIAGADEFGLLAGGQSVEHIQLLPVVCRADPVISRPVHPQ